MTLNEFKEMIENEIKLGYGEFEVFTYDCDGGYSSELVINIDERNKEVKIIS